MHLPSQIPNHLFIEISNVIDHTISTFLELSKPNYTSIPRVSKSNHVFISRITKSFGPLFSYITLDTPFDPVQGLKLKHILTSLVAHTLPSLDWGPWGLTIWWPSVDCLTITWWSFGDHLLIIWISYDIHLLLFWWSITYHLLIIFCVWNGLLSIIW